MTDRDRSAAATQSWMEGYLRAWETNDPAHIAALFTPDARYVTDPWKPPSVGIDAIVAEWLRRADAPGTFSFTWEIVGLDGERAFVQGETRYASGTVYSNLWVIDLTQDGRASSFTEWWMDQSDPS